jgi:hypothetical protein
MRADAASMRYLRPSTLLVAGGAVLASLALFVFPGGEVRLVPCALVVALTAVLHRAATTESTRAVRPRHDARLAEPVPVRADDPS